MKATTNPFTDTIALCANSMEAARLYALAILLWDADGKGHFAPEFNAAILARWSPSGLEWIKRRAWEEVLRWRAGVNVEVG